jgi:hypothetical protein
MVGSRSCSRDLLELGNDDLLWTTASGNPVSHLSWVVIYSVVFAWVGFAFVVVHATFGCLVHIFALYLSMKAGKTDLSKKNLIKIQTIQHNPIKARPHKQMSEREVACSVNR